MNWRNQVDEQLWKSVFGCKRESYNKADFNSAEGISNNRNGSKMEFTALRSNNPSFTHVRIKAEWPPVKKAEKGILYRVGVHYFKEKWSCFVLLRFYSVWGVFCFLFYFNKNIHTCSKKWNNKVIVKSLLSPCQFHP